MLEITAVHELVYVFGDRAGDVQRAFVRWGAARERRTDGLAAWFREYLFELRDGSLWKVRIEGRSMLRDVTWSVTEEQWREDTSRLREEGETTSTRYLVLPRLAGVLAVVPGVIDRDLVAAALSEIDRRPA